MLKNKDFQLLLKNGRRCSGGFVVSYTLPSDQNRLGVVVSKKISRLAHERNKVKRRLREAGRRLLKDGFDVILIARPGIEKKTWLEVLEAVKKII